VPRTAEALMSRVYITLDDLDLPILEIFIEIYRENRSLEALMDKQTSIIISLSAEIDRLKEHLGLPKTEKDGEHLAKIKELVIGGLDHLFWSRGFQAYTDPYTGEVDQDWKPPKEGEQRDAKHLAPRNPKIIDLLMFQTQRRKDGDDEI
jgi:hypothetical protein